LPHKVQGITHNPIEEEGSQEVAEGIGVVQRQGDDKCIQLD